MDKKGLPFYRCVLCRGVVSPWDIQSNNHACPKCGGKRISPSNLSWFETVVQIIKHPAIWRWDEKYFHE